MHVRMLMNGSEVNKRPKAVPAGFKKDQCDSLNELYSDF